MDWQLNLVVLVVVVAALYLGRATWRAWRGSGKCATGCHCGPKPDAATHQTLIPSDSLRIKPRQ